MQIAQGKGWDSSVTEQVSAVRQLLGPAADDRLVALDVGAGVGAWTLHALSALPNVRIHAFEPSSVAMQRLEVAVGKSDGRVSVHQLALSDCDGEGVLYANEPGSPIASLTRRKAVSVEFSYEEQVRTTTLQSWSRSSGIDTVDVLKLEVGGHEMDVLTGAGDLLQRMQVIQFEFGGSNIDTRTYFGDFWDLLAGAGWRIYRLCPNGLLAKDRYRECCDEVFRTTTYFASPTDSRSRA
jgi:FkbM family methyltransferase